MDWQEIQKTYSTSFDKDFEAKDWMGTGADIKCRVCQEWTEGRDVRFLTPDQKVQDLYLDNAWIAEGWRKFYGVPKLRDFVEPASQIEIGKQKALLNATMPWRVFAGQQNYITMYKKTAEILDLAMRMVCAKYPRPGNERFVLGDAGGSSGNHAQHTGDYTALDLNYCTTTGHNMTHYKFGGAMPREYANGYIQNGIVNIWLDEFPYRRLETSIFDTAKNYALYELLGRLFPRGEFLTSTGINIRFKKDYGGSVLQGDDVESHRHYWHVHFYLRGEINYDALMTTM